MCLPPEVREAGAAVARHLAEMHPQELYPEVLQAGYTIARRLIRAENASAILALAVTCQKLGIDTLRIIRLPQPPEEEPQALEVNPKQLEQILK